MRGRDMSISRGKEETRNEGTRDEGMRDEG